jgi:hypothetical protein
MVAHTSNHSTGEAKARGESQGGRCSNKDIVGATWKAEIRRITVLDWPGQKNC